MNQDTEQMTDAVIRVLNALAKKSRVRGAIYMSLHQTLTGWERRVSSEGGVYWVRCSLELDHQVMVAPVPDSGASSMPFQWQAKGRDGRVECGMGMSEMDAKHKADEAASELGWMWAR